jgi:hypothetical protein
LRYVRLLIANIQHKARRKGDKNKQQLPPPHEITSRKMGSRPTMYDALEYYRGVEDVLDLYALVSAIS